MDLGTVTKKVLNNEYREVHEVYDDVRLVWRNCLKFNEEGSEVSRACTVLKAIADKKWKNANLARGHSG
jgi:bromodomain-containing factor 1